MSALADLILVPTSREMEKLRPLLIGDHNRLAFQLCGFGPIAAAARAGALIARYKPERVLLVGIAGSFDTERYPLGTACRFDQVTCTGIGVGTGDNHRSAHELGWSQFSGRDAKPEIGDVITLDSTYVTGVASAGQLLTCCSASADLEEAAQRHKLFPDAVAEDMEGFAVAMACSFARVPLQIIRGISNRVGNRDHASWRIDDALASAAEMASRLMPRAWMPLQS